MRGTLTTAFLVLAATLVAAAAAWAEEAGAPTREEYVAQVDPICKTNTDANKRLLKGASEKAERREARRRRRPRSRGATATFGKIGEGNRSRSASHRQTARGSKSGSAS